MKTMFNLSCLNADGDRVLVGAAQGRHMHETRESAEAYLAAFLENNSDERLASIFGRHALGTFRVDAFECYDHGDPIGRYVKEGE